MFNLPNLITIFRLMAAILIGLWPSPLWNLVLFTLAAGTDWLDGVLARRWNQTTKLGAMLDPIADKALVMIALIALALGPIGDALGVVLGAMATVIIFREVLIAGMREFLGDARNEIKVTQLAKWKTALQMVGIGLVFLGVYLWDLGQSGGSDTYVDYLRARSIDLGVIGLGLAALLTVITAVDYWIKALPYLKDDAR